MIKAIVVAVAILAAFALGIAVHVRTGDGPYCPTEDSCQIDYRDGTWTVTEVVP